MPGAAGHFIATVRGEHAFDRRNPSSSATASSIDARDPSRTVVEEGRRGPVRGES